MRNKKKREKGIMKGKIKMEKEIKNREKNMSRVI